MVKEAHGRNAKPRTKRDAELAGSAAAIEHKANVVCAGESNQPEKPPEVEDERESYVSGRQNYFRELTDNAIDAASGNNPSEDRAGTNDEGPELSQVEGVQNGQECFFRSADLILATMEEENGWRQAVRGLGGRN
jgi:hypothetical protein